MKFDTSGWGEFKLSDLFSVNSSNKIFHANKIKEIYDIEQENTYPYVVRSAVNNGIRGYINENEKFLNPANTLSFAQDTFSVFYQEKPYFTGNKVKVLMPKFENFNKIIALFIVANYQKSLIDFSWGTSSTTSDIEDIMIGLPTKNNEPDWEFMENTIKSTQNKMTKIIKAYELVKNGGGGTFNLNAYKQYLSSNPNLTPLSTLQWREFKIGELFNNIRQGARLKQADHIKGNLPFVMAGTENTGISGFIGNENARKFKANALTIDIFGNVFYRAYEFGASDDVGVFWNENNSVKEKSMLFLSAVISKALQGKFDFGHKLRASQSYDIKILLPVNQNNTIAFEFMETFIKAVEKEAIKSVVLWSEKRLNATKQVISKPL